MFLSNKAVKQKLVQINTFFQRTITNCKLQKPLKLFYCKLEMIIKNVHYSTVQADFGSCVASVFSVFPTILYF